MEFFVGLPVSPESIREEGLQKTMDKLAAARVNAIIFNAHNPDGAHYRYHEDQYAFTRLKPFCNVERDVQEDMLQKVCDAASRYGMQVYSHTMCYEGGLPGFWPAGAGRETISRQLKNFTDCSQIDLFGRQNFRPCLNNPEYRQYYLSAVRDQLLHYPLEGINFNLERNGPISHVLVGQYAASVRSRKPMAPICFCPHCMAKARENGIRIDRARQGWMELLEFSERSWRQAKNGGDPFAGDGVPLGNEREDTTPANGYFMTFFRLMMRYPEILQWNQMWFDAINSFFAEVYSTAKMSNPQAKVGLHIWHHRAMSIFERAGYDYDVLRRCCDWIKPKMDPVCGGYRYHLDIRRYHQALFYDVPIEKMYDAWNTMLGFTSEPPFDQLPASGMSMDYLYRDVAWAVQESRGEVPIYPGIGLDMPTPAKTTEPEDVKRELHTIYRAGAKGVILSRSLGEMRECNLKAAGDAIDEINAIISEERS
ncbi:MAG: hypothetical protein Q4G52_01765 [Clostridia bacterium]|nr:hypothetical protein [Clostridia bacterium]